MKPTGYLTVTPEEGSPYQIPWTAPCVYDKEPAPAVKIVRPPTQAEEIFEEVKEWYRVQGKPVPISDAKACLDMIKAEKKEPEPEPERPKTMEEQLGPKPMWGDPLFWDYWRKAKALGFTNDKKKKK
jgi:hypothetical protein